MGFNVLLKHAEDLCYVIYYIRVPHPVSMYTFSVRAAVYQPSLICDASHSQQNKISNLLLKVGIHNIVTILNTVVFEKS